MVRKIAVVGPGPAWRRGVAAVLTDAGFATVELESLSAWKPGRGGTSVALRATDATMMATIAEFASEYPHIPLIVVMPEVGAGEYASALRSGALGAVADDDTAEAYTLAFEGAYHGRSVVPSGLMRAMAARLPPILDESWLSADDTQRLRRLAVGSTVAELADHAGYSEREMFRMLNSLYDTLGVANRTQAIIWAARHGVLDDPDTRHG